MLTDVQPHIIGPDGRPILDTLGPLPDGARVRVPVALMDARADLTDGWGADVFKAAGVPMRTPARARVADAAAPDGWGLALASLRAQRARGG